MQLFQFLVIGLMVVAAVLTVTEQRRMDVPPAAVSAQQQVDQYRMFMFVAALYMRNYGGGAATLTWDQLKTAPGAPSGAVNSGMPANWKVVVGTDATWVACTPLDERAIGAISQLATGNSLSLVPTELNGQNYFVVGAPADAGKASQC